MRARKKYNLAEAEINLTPLIDVCFVILIMFIVVAPILEMEKVQLASGPPIDAKSLLPLQEKSAINIYVHADDSITINQVPVSESQLTTMLSWAKQKNSAARPQLYHDKNARFGTYQKVKNAAEAAGFNEIDLILKPE
jgi:biopolymer transport protein ExbD